MCVFVSEYEHVPILLVTTVVFRANYQYISLDSMEKFLSYASNGISFSIGIEMHAISLPMIFIFLENSYPMSERRPLLEELL